MTRTIKARGSKFAEAILEFKGNPVLFGEKYEPQKMVYDLYPEFLVLKAGRQVGKEPRPGWPNQHRLSITEVLQFSIHCP